MHLDLFNFCVYTSFVISVQSLVPTFLGPNVLNNRRIKELKLMLFLSNELAN